MNKDKILAALENLKRNNVICYIYRESVFEILSYGRVDSTLYLLSDSPVDTLKEKLVKCEFTDVADGESGYISARLSSQKIELLCGDDLTADRLMDTIRHDLSIHSMMMRGKGDIYDVFGGLDDFQKKQLRLTREDITDKNAFAKTCFELILRSGFSADAKLTELLNKSLREQPMGRRVALMMTFRNYIKSDNRDIQNILNALSLRGMFPKAPKLSDRMSKGLEEKLKLMRLMQYSALTCYLCGIKGEQLNNIQNVGFAREFYDCFLKHIDDDLSDRKQYEAAKKNCTKECFETLLAVKEVLSMLSGESFSVKPKAAGNLFKELENSDGWRKEGEKPKAPPAQKSIETPPSRQPAEESPEEPAADVLLEFEGQTEENYIEDDEAELTSEPPIGDIPVRRPGENFYLQQK